MDIRLPSSLLPTQFGGKSVAALLSLLQPGQQVTVMVETQLAENSFLLKLGDSGQTLRAHTQLNLIPGQTLKLEVTKAGATPELKLLPPARPLPSVETTAIQQAFRELLPKQQSVAGLVSVLSKLINLPQGDQKIVSLPEPVRSAIQATMEALPKKDELTSADGLKRAVSDSGVFFEAKLAVMAPQGTLNKLPQDLKGQLLTLSQRLQPPSEEVNYRAPTTLLSSQPIIRSALAIAATATPKITTQQATDAIQQSSASINAKPTSSLETTTQPVELRQNANPSAVVRQTELSTTTPLPPTFTARPASADMTYVPPVVVGTIRESAAQGEIPRQPLSQSTPQTAQALPTPIQGIPSAPENGNPSHAGENIVGKTSASTITVPASESELEPSAIPDRDSVQISPPGGIASREPSSAKCTTPGLLIPVEINGGAPSNPAELPIASQPTTITPRAPPHEQQPPAQQATVSETLPESQSNNPKHIQPPPAPERALKEFVQTQSQGTPTADQPSTELRSLHHQTEGALARIVLDQLASLPNSDGKLLSWQLEIPFADGRDVGSAKLKIAKDSSSPGASLEEAFWSVAVEISPPGLGTIHSRITLNGERVNTYFWADEEATTELIHAGLDTLAARLKQAGLEIGQIDTLPAPPADMAKKLPALVSKLLDERA